MVFSQYIKSDALVIQGLLINVGELVNFLQNRTHITKLSLVSCGINTEGVKVLARLTNLTELDLSSNRISDEDARALANLTNLTKLHLQNNKIGVGGVRALVNLTNLTELDLSSNQMATKDAKALANLTNLTRLHLQNNRIGVEGAKALANLTNLTELDLGYNNLGSEGVKALANLTNLTELDLDSNDIGNEGVKALVNLTNLTRLHLQYDLICDEGIQALVNFPCFEQLKELSLRGNFITAGGIETLAQSLYLKHRTEETKSKVELCVEDDYKRFCDSLIEAYSENRSVHSLNMDNVKKMIFSVAECDHLGARVIKYVLEEPNKYPFLVNSRDNEGYLLSHFYRSFPEVQSSLFKRGLIPWKELEIGECPSMKKPRMADFSSREERSDEEREVIINKQTITPFVENLAEKLIQYAISDPDFKKALVDVFMTGVPVDCEEPERITLEQQRILAKINQEFCKSITRYLRNYDRGIPKIDEYKIIISQLYKVGRVQTFLRSSLGETQSLQEVSGQFSDASTENILEQKQNHLY